MGTINRKSRKFRRFLVLCITVALTFSMATPAFAVTESGDSPLSALNAAIGLGNSPVRAYKSVSAGVERVSGNDRHATCLRVADALKKELGVSKFEAVVVARGDRYEDALSGDYLAIVEKAPIILMSKGNNSAALNYIQSNLKAGGNIYILGGNQAVTPAVETSLKGITPNVVRLAGAHRYDTNLKVLEQTLVTEEVVVVPPETPENEQQEEPGANTEEELSPKPEANGNEGQSTKPGGNANGDQPAAPGVNSDEGQSAEPGANVGEDENEANEANEANTPSNESVLGDQKTIGDDSDESEPGVIINRPEDNPADNPDAPVSNEPGQTGSETNPENPGTNQPSEPGVNPENPGANQPAESGSNPDDSQPIEPGTNPETPEINPQAEPETKTIKIYKSEDLLVCSGMNFPDALSASAVGKPIMLVGDKLTKSQENFLEEYRPHIKSIYIIGGTAAVNKDIENQLSKFRAPKRIAGNTRYSTATAIAKTFFGGAPQVVIASGQNFPDGLCGGVLANAKESPLLLTTTKDLGFSASYQYVFKNSGIKRVTILGGTSVVAADAIALTETGARKTGLLNVGGKKYFADGNGNFAKSKFVTAGAKKYYADSNGVITTNRTVTVNGETWFAGGDGSVSKADKIIYLTFDDGPGPYTEKLINILNKYGAKATFFVNANRPAYNYCIRKAYETGHAIGNHTNSHNYAYCYSSTANFWADVEACNKIIKAQTGTTTKLLRFPGGSSNLVSTNYAYGIMSTLARQCSQKGYVYFDWNVDSNDAGGTTSSSGVYYNIINGVSGMKASVVLCHDIKGYTVDAIEDVIKWGQRNGYVFLPLTTSSPTAHHGIAN